MPRLPIGHAFYSGIVGLHTIVARVPLTWFRTATGRAWRTELDERLGRARLPIPGGWQRIIVHVGFVDDAPAATALVAEIARSWPGVRVVLTSGTVPARIVAERFRIYTRTIETCLFLPWDGARRMRAWLADLRASAVIGVGAMPPPNLVRACRLAHVPVAIVNARPAAFGVSPGRRLVRDLLGAPRWIATQGEDHAAQLLAMGAPAERLAVTGDLEFDAPVVTEVVPPAWRRSLETPGLLVMIGDSHHPEEAWMADCLLRLRHEMPTVRLVVAPRDPGRAAALCRMFHRRALRAARWSAPQDPQTRWDVLVIDRPSWLPSLYRFADVIVDGSTLAPPAGRGLIGAASSERAVLLGPHISEVVDLVRGLGRLRGCARLAGNESVQAEIYPAVRSLLLDPERRMAIGLRARQWYDANAGVARLVVSRLQTQVLQQAPALAEQETPSTDRR